jgi:hypothetical protein
MERATVICVEDAPGFEVGDDAFDGGTNGTDLAVEFFVGWVERDSGRFRIGVIMALSRQNWIF